MIGLGREGTGSDLLVVQAGVNDEDWRLQQHLAWEVPMSLRLEVLAVRYQ